MIAKKLKLYISPEIRYKATRLNVLKKSFEYMRDKIDTSRIEDYIDNQQKIWFEFL